MEICLLETDRIGFFWMINAQIATDENVKKKKKELKIRYLKNWVSPIWKLFRQ